MCQAVSRHKRNTKVLGNLGPMTINKQKNKYLRFWAVTKSSEEKLGRIRKQLFGERHSW